MKLKSYRDLPQFVTSKSSEVLIIHRNRDHISGLLQSQLGASPVESISNAQSLKNQMDLFFDEKNYSFREYPLSPDLLTTWLFRVKTPFDPLLDYNTGDDCVLYNYNKILISACCSDRSL